MMKMFKRINKYIISYNYANREGCEKGTGSFASDLDASMTAKEMHENWVSHIRSQHPKADSSFCFSITGVFKL